VALTEFTTDMAIIAALADLPNASSGLTAAQLKAKFDEGGTALKTYINDTLIPALESTTDGSSGADQIGATAITELTGTTVQSLLESLKTYIDNAILGAIPNGSITDAKLSVAAEQILARFTTHKDSYENHGNLKNRVINGNFSVNQLVKSGTVTLVAGEYGHDMWKAGASGCTYTFATSLNVTTITITAGSLLQIIEGVNLFSGTHTLSWAGTAQGKIGAGSYGAAGITGIAVGGTNLTIEFNTGTLSKAQLEEGDYKTPYELRPRALELELCEYHYQKSYSYGSAPGATSSLGALASFVSSAGVIAGVRFNRRMRTAPIVNIYSPTGTLQKVWSNADTDISSGVNAANISDNGMRYLNATGGGLTDGQMVTFHYTADARL
jgi:hypothetical protein